ncbi:hypothetical protein IWZ01DRAFT_478580 [Phyllosticta capitalensis]
MYPAQAVGSCCSPGRRPPHFRFFHLLDLGIHSIAPCAEVVEHHHPIVKRLKAPHIYEEFRICWPFFCSHIAAFGRRPCSSPSTSFRLNAPCMLIANIVVSRKPFPSCARARLASPPRHRPLNHFGCSAISVDERLNAPWHSNDTLDTTSFPESRAFECSLSAHLLIPAVFTKNSYKINTTFPARACASLRCRALARLLSRSPRTAQLFRRRPAARLSAAAVAATATTTTPPPPPPPPQLARAPLHDGNGPFGARFYGLAVRCAGVMVGVVVGSGPDKPDWRQSTTAASPSAFDRHVPQRRHPDIGLLGPVGGVIWRAALQIDWYQREPPSSLATTSGKQSKSSGAAPEEPSSSHAATSDKKSKSTRCALKEPSSSHSASVRALWGGFCGGMEGDELLLTMSMAPDTPAAAGGSYGSTYRQQHHALIS